MDNIDKMRDYFNLNKTRSYEFRIKQLKKLKESIQKNEKQIVKALNDDLGKSEFEAYASEILMIYEELNKAINNLRKWMKIKRVKSPIYSIFSKSYIKSEPRGIVLIISPWNYPFQLTISPLIGSIAAGNLSLVKVSKNAKHTKKVIKMIIESTFSKNYISYVNGGNEEVNEIIDYGVNYIFFTGSPKVGKILMERAAKNLTPVTLELGGKSPVFVDKEANLDISATRIAWGKFMNAGQTCIAPDYALVHESVVSEFVDLIIKKIKKFYGKDSKKSVDLGRIINKRQIERLIKYLDCGKIVYGGDFDVEELYMSPTIMTDVGIDSAIMRDEIFGPILPIITYSKLDDAINYVKKGNRPLATYIFTDNKDVENRIINEIPYGGGCVNDTLSHISNINLPFGGNGNSGMGQYHGKQSFDLLSHKKSILKKPTIIKYKYLLPPYANKVNMLKKFIK